MKKRKSENLILFKTWWVENDGPHRCFVPMAEAVRMVAAGDYGLNGELFTVNKSHNMVHVFTNN